MFNSKTKHFMPVIRNDFITDKYLPRELQLQYNSLTIKPYATQNSQPIEQTFNKPDIIAFPQGIHDYSKMQEVSHSGEIGELFFEDIF